MSEPKNSRAGGTLSSQEVGILLDQLAAGVSEQQPLDEIFRALAEDVEDTRLSAVASQLADEFAQGADMKTATDSVAHLLPAHLRGALALGVESGNLSGVLTGLAESELARKRMQRGLRGALTYPMFVLAFLSLVLLFMSVMVVPHFATLFEDLDAELPRATIFTLRIAEVLPKVLVALLVAGGVVIFAGLSVIRGRFPHWVRTALPLLGRTWIWVGQHEFATLMSALTQQGLPITAALTCTQSSLRDKNLAWATEQVSQRCANGATLSQSLRESLHFDPTLCALMEWGESNGSLPLALRQAAETYEQEMTLFTHFLHRVLPPLMLTVVASTMFYMIASLIVPLVNMIGWLY